MFPHYIAILREIPSDHPQEWVELYLYSPSGPSGSVIGRTVAYDQKWVLTFM
jgi:hypothetical protein